MPVEYIGSGGGGGGGQPTVNPSDAFSIAIAVADTNAVPTEVVSLGLAVADTNALPTDAVSIALTVTDTNALPTDGFSLNIGAADTNALPTDAITLAIAMTVTDTNATPTELPEFAFTVADTNALPTEARTTAGNFWHSSQVNTGASGITNPANLLNPNDGVFAVLSTVTLGTNPISITASTAVGNNTAVNSALYRGFYKYASGVAGTFTVTAFWTGNAGGTTIETGTATVDHSVTPKTFDLFAAGLNTLAKVQSLTVRYQEQATLAGTGGTLSVDAASLDMNNPVA